MGEGDMAVRCENAFNLMPPKQLAVCFNLITYITDAKMCVATLWGPVVHSQGSSLLLVLPRAI